MLNNKDKNKEIYDLIVSAYGSPAFKLTSSKHHYDRAKRRWYRSCAETECDAETFKKEYWKAQKRDHEVFISNLHGKKCDKTPYKLYRLVITNENEYPRCLASFLEEELIKHIAGEDSEKDQNK